MKPENTDAQGSAGSAPKLRRYAFVVNASTPIASWSLLERLRAEFPDHEVDVFNLSEELKRHPVVLATCVAEALLTYGWPILSGKKKLRNVIFRTVTVERFIQRRLASRVSPETHDFVLQMQSLWSARIPGLPHFIYTDHTNLSNAAYPDPYLDAIYSKSFLARERKTLQQASTVFTRSKNITQHVIELYGVEPSHVECVYAGANTEGKVCAPSSAVPRQNDNPVILFIGIDWHRKGGPELVNAYMQILEDHPNAELQIVGCTPADLPDVPGINVLGRLPTEQLVDLYRSATVFCMPTLREPFGVVFIEALSFGLPIIATDVGAIPDFVIPGRNGVLVEPRNSQQIANALSQLLSSPERCRAFGEESLAIARERYTWTLVAQHISRRIKSFVEQPG